MNTPTLDRAQLIESVKALPDESLAELSSFIDYLEFKKATVEPRMTGKEFLFSVAGLGNSEESDISERDEEILSQEIDPIKGWSSYASQSE
ncbi:MAG: hypothetical protein AAF810_14915 [Cyanobacteria bacterium P01_D01_bin.36]